MQELNSRRHQSGLDSGADIFSHSEKLIAMGCMKSLMHCQHEHVHVPSVTKGVQLLKGFMSRACPFGAWGWSQVAFFKCREAQEGRAPKEACAPNRHS